MIFFFSNFALSFRLSNYGNQGDLVSMKQAPVFMDKGDEAIFPNGKFNVSTKLTGYSGTLRGDEYIRSSVLVDGAVFEYNYAFGEKLYASGKGGAVFLSYSSLFVEGNFGFRYNKGESGGAIYTLMSSLVIEAAEISTTCFIGNTAFIKGGAIYFQGGYEKTDSGQILTDKLYVSIKGNRSFKKESFMFNSNKAGDIAGAIFFSNTKNIIINDCGFTQNTASIKGGAIFSHNSNIICTDSFFLQNTVQNIKFKPKPTEKTTQLGAPLSARGGGAIYFTARKETLKDEKGFVTKLLATTSCCFIGDSAEGSTDFNGSAGHEIMMSGYTSWDSYNDHAKLIDGLSIGCFAFKDFKPIINVFNMNEGDLYKACTYSFVNESTEEATEVVFQKPVRYQGENKVKAIPSPTEYIYQATAIPETPYATTSSWSVYSSFRSIPTMPSLKTVRKTLFSTPFITPQKTIDHIRERNVTISTIINVSTMVTTKTKDSNGMIVFIYMPSYYTTLTAIFTIIGIDSSDSEEAKGLSNASVIAISTISSIVAFISIAIIVFIYKEKQLQDLTESDNDLSEIELQEKTKKAALIFNEDEDKTINQFLGRSNNKEEKINQYLERKATIDVSFFDNLNF